MASILEFRVRRTSSGDAYADIHVKPTSTTYLSGGTLHLEYSSSGFDVGSVVGKDLTTAFGVANMTLVGKESSVLIGSNFDNNTNYYFTLYFSDGRFSAAPARSVLFGTKNPLVVAKNNCGVAIGGVPEGTNGAPKFVSYWPAKFKGGIESFGSEWTSLEGNLASGVTTGMDRTIGMPLRCKKVADKYIIDGVVQVKPGSSTIVLADLPIGWVPGGDVFALNPCEGVENPRVARIAVGGQYSDNRGKLCLSWVKNIKDGSSYTSDKIWVKCNIEFYDAGGDIG